MNQYPLLIDMGPDSCT